MMGFIYFKKSGLYTRSFKKYKKIERPISCYMRHIPKFEKGFTVADLMQILKEYENDVNLIFLAYTRGFELQPFYEEMNLPLEKEPEKYKRENEILKGELEKFKSKYKQLLAHSETKLKKLQHELSSKKSSSSEKIHHKDKEISVRVK